MAEPITQARLKALAAVHPDQGRVLSVFLNLDPAQFATPNARSSAITSVITAAAHKVEESDGLSHDERMALRDDVERVREVLIGSDIAANGTRAVAVYACGPEDPPEEWLVKAWDGDTLVDLIFYPKGTPVDDALIERGEVMSVLGMEMRVMALEDVLVTKLMALSEYSLRYESLLPIARALRERVDWDDVRARTAESPFARAFFVMLEGLGIVPEAKPTTGGHETRVRVLTQPGSTAAHVG